MIPTSYSSIPKTHLSHSFSLSTKKAETETLGNFLEDIREAKQSYMEFTDAYGRDIPKDQTLEQFRALQPFYITKMAPMTIKLKIKLPDNEVMTLDIDSLSNITAVEEHVEKVKGIPRDQQKYFYQGKLVRHGYSFINQQFCENEMELCLILKPFIRIKGAGEEFILYTELTNLMLNIRRMIKMRSGVVEDQQMIFKGDTELTENFTSEWS